MELVDTLFNIIPIQELDDACVWWKDFRGFTVKSAYAHLEGIFDQGSPLTKNKVKAFKLLW